MNVIDLIKREWIPAMQDKIEILTTDQLISADISL